MRGDPETQRHPHGGGARTDARTHRNRRASSDFLTHISHEWATAANGDEEHETKRTKQETGRKLGQNRSRVYFESAAQMAPRRGPSTEFATITSAPVLFSFLSGFQCFDSLLFGFYWVSPCFFSVCLTRFVSIREIPTEMLRKAFGLFFLNSVN